MILYSVDNGVAGITLNRPEKRNALNDELIAEIKRGLRTAAADDTVRVIVISGAGKDFCSGADLSALQKIAQASVSDNADDARALLELFILIRQIRVPVVAAVKGRALAGGYGGARIGRRMPPTFVRVATLILCAAITIAFFIRTYHGSLP